MNHLNRPLEVKRIDELQGYFETVRRRITEAARWPGLFPPGTPALTGKEVAA